MKDVEHRVATASVAAVARHLRAVDPRFDPPLHRRVELDAFALRIVSGAVTFEAWQDDELVGLVSAYVNAGPGGTAFINHVGVAPGHEGRGLATTLLRACMAYAARAAHVRVRLEVAEGNRRARDLYFRLGFVEEGPPSDTSVFMTRDLPHAPSRDYDAEQRDAAGSKYAYSFDFDVIHPFMVRSFRPFLRSGSFLELGSYRGDFTRHLLPFGGKVTCVEASSEALAHARARHGDAVAFVHGRFETVQLPGRYDNVILTHVLEHLDDPVALLRRIADEWLAEGGRLFVACPNAHAPSRQIAVKMGLLSHTTAVSPSEAEHGHRVTYTLDTLERDVRAGGLDVLHRSGVFFKALANFQWDRLLGTDIISDAYLEGCYQLGMVYPDLCSSIFLVCERRTRP